MRTVYLAWQDPFQRRWYPIGRLTREDAFFRFEYVQGALQAMREVGFEPIISFPEFGEIYLSEKLFPLFQNRIMAPSRPEYRDYLSWLDVSVQEAEPLLLLGRSGGHRATDTFRVFPVPEVTENQRYQTRFFVHGLPYMPEAAQKRALSLAGGERLLLMHDFQNEQDDRALLLRSVGDERGEDITAIGYCPRYLVDDLQALMAIPSSRASIRVTVVRVNPPPAPSQVRVLCSLEAHCPAGFVPLAAELFQPLPALADVA